MRTTGTFRAATVDRASGSAVRADTSLTASAPAATAALATAALVVSMVMGTVQPALRMPLMTGTTRAVSSASNTGIAPGRVDSPPTSRMSAPSSASFRAWATASSVV